MTKRRKIRLALVGILAFVILLCAVFAPPSEPEPSYKGAPLSQWLNVLQTPEGKAEQRVAIRHIGTNAIPFLLRWIQYEAPPKLVRELAKIPANTVGYRGFIEHQDMRAIRADGVVEAFECLGSDAKAAIPDLTRIMITSKGRNTGCRAAFSLAAIGQDSLPSILTALTNHQLEARFWAYTAFIRMGTNALPAVPALTIALKNPDPEVQIVVSNALKRATQK